ncbi:MAG: glutathione S-transferase family protein [Alphaproteobacteria bacterium]|nr:glutathione S-transferase family protein [Alphaproteobacteria bacterium]
MAEATLIIGNKNYSSWSLRGWLAVKQAGVPFDEILVNLGDDDFKAQLKSHSKAGKVPVLIHDGLEIWDTLSIIEYLAETYPHAGLWPKDPTARAAARSVSAEMHSSFSALRSHMPMNIRASHPDRGRGPGVDQDIARITEIWRDRRVAMTDRRVAVTDRRAAVAESGDFLFGAWSAADAMYAPVVSRFKTYGVALDDVCQRYADAVLGCDLFKEWETEALKEAWIVPEDEIGAEPARA